MRRLPALLLLLAAVALSIILLRPLCAAMFSHADAHDAGACCVNVSDAAASKSVDLATGPAGGKPLLVPVLLSVLSGAVLLSLSAAVRFPRSVLPQRSFYARSARVLR